MTLFRDSKRRTFKNELEEEESLYRLTLSLNYKIETEIENHNFYAFEVGLKTKTKDLHFKATAMFPGFQRGHELK